MLDVLLNLTYYDGQLFLNNPDDAIKFQNHIQNLTVTDTTRMQFPILNTGSTTIALPAASIDLLAISCDQALTLNLNGSATAITLTPYAAGTKTLAYLSRGAITEVQISNNSGQKANIDLVMVVL